MKHTMLTLLVLLSVSSSSFSQNEDVYKIIAQETCDCLAKKNYDYSTADKADVQMTLGLCLIESAQRNNLKLEIGNTQAMTELGQKVGLLMAPLCPDFFKVFIKKEGAVEEMEEQDDTEFFTVSGKIKVIEEKDFLYVILKETSGREHKFIWLLYFSGSDEFIDDPKKLVGKDVTITYMTLEALQPKSKTYYNLNIIQGLEMK